MDRGCVHCFHGVPLDFYNVHVHHGSLAGWQTMEMKSEAQAYYEELKGRLVKE